MDTAKTAGAAAPKKETIEKGAKTEKNAPVNKDGQATLPVIDDLVKAEIAKELNLTHQFQEARMEALKHEKLHRQAAQALMEKYGVEGEFKHGEGADQIRGFFETTKKLKVRKGEAAAEEK